MWLYAKACHMVMYSDSGRRVWYHGPNFRPEHFVFFWVGSGPYSGTVLISAKLPPYPSLSITTFAPKPTHFNKRASGLVFHFLLSAARSKKHEKKRKEKKKPLLLMALSNPFLFSPRSVHKFNPLLLSHLPLRKPIPLISSHRVRRFVAPHWSFKRFNRKFSGVFAFSLLSFDLRFS